MRTTITLEGDAFDVAQTDARARARKLGQAVFERIRRSCAERLPMRQRGDSRVFDLPADAPKFSAARVKALLHDTH